MVASSDRRSSRRVCLTLLISYKVTELSSLAFSFSSSITSLTFSSYVQTKAGISSRSLTISFSDLSFNFLTCDSLYSSSLSYTSISVNSISVFRSLSSSIVVWCSTSSVRSFIALMLSVKQVCLNSFSFCLGILDKASG